MSPSYIYLAIALFSGGFARAQSILTFPEAELQQVALAQLQEIGYDSQQLRTSGWSPSSSHPPRFTTASVASTSPLDWQDPQYPSIAVVPLNKTVTYDVYRFDPTKKPGVSVSNTNVNATRFSFALRFRLLDPDPSPVAAQQIVFISRSDGFFLVSVRYQPVSGDVLVVLNRFTVDSSESTYQFLFGGPNDNYEIKKNEWMTLGVAFTPINGSNLSTVTARLVSASFDTGYQSAYKIVRPSDVAQETVLFVGLNITLARQPNDNYDGTSVDAHMDLSGFAMLEGFGDNLLSNLMDLVRHFKLEEEAVSEEVEPEFKLALGLGLGIGLGLITLLGAYRVIRVIRNKRKKQRPLESESPLVSIVLPLYDKRKESSPGASTTPTTSATPTSLPSRRVSSAVPRAIDPDLLPTAQELNKELCMARGFFGSVYVLKWNDQPIALKVFDFAAAGHNIASDYSKEVEILSALEHPHIVRLVGHSVSSDLKGYMVMELCEGLSLLDWLYPQVAVVVPPEVAAQPETGANYAQMISEVANYISTYGHVSNFGLIRMAPSPIVSTSQDGQRILKEASVGSKLASVSSSWSTVAAPSITSPAVIIYVGPLCYIWEISTTFYLSTSIQQCLTQVPVLSFGERVRIAFEAWRGCSFLHAAPATSGRPTLVHGDIKPANILLDARLSAKVADVGLAKLVRPSEGMSYVSKPAAFGPTGETPGYADPALQMPRPRHGEKNDVYSFGVVLSELLPAYLPTTPALRAAVDALIAQCLAPWEKRATSAQVLASLETLHALFQQSQAQGAAADVSTGLHQIQLANVVVKQLDSAPSYARSTPTTDTPSTSRGADLQAPESADALFGEPWLLSSRTLPTKWTGKLIQNSAPMAQPPSTALASAYVPNGNPAMPNAQSEPRPWGPGLGNLLINAMPGPNVGPNAL